jgi:hypothetical protein
VGTWAEKITYTCFCACSYACNQFRGKAIFHKGYEFCILAVLKLR